jgi:hypothetical protein
MQLKFMRGGEFVPQLLQLNRGFWLSIGPQQSHHFAEGSNPPIFSLSGRSQLIDDVTYHLRKKLAVRLAVACDFG